MKNNSLLLILLVLVVGGLVYSGSVSSDFFGLSRLSKFNQYSFSFSDSVIPGGRGVIVGVDDEFNIVRNAFAKPESKPGLLIGKDSFGLKLVEWPLESAACLQSFLKDTSSFQLRNDVSGFSDWQVPSSCLKPAVIEFNEYSTTGLGPKVRRSLKIGDSVKINPYMTVKYVGASLSREFRTPDLDPDSISVYFELSIDSFDFLNIGTSMGGATYDLDSPGVKRFKIDNKLYPNLEAFVDYKSINRGLEAEQTTYVLNNPYVLLKMGSNDFDVNVDTNLIGLREDDFLYGFYLRSEDGSVYATYDNNMVSSNHEVGEGLPISNPDVVINKNGTVVLSNVDTGFVPSSEPSIKPVAEKSYTGIAVGSVLVVLLVGGGIFLFFTKTGVSWRKKVFKR